MFWKGTGAEIEQEAKSKIDTEQTLVQHGSVVTEEVVNRMEPFQRERIEKLRSKAEACGTIPEFHVSNFTTKSHVLEGDWS